MIGAIRLLPFIALAGLSGFAYWQYNRANTLTAELALVKAQLSTCGGRLQAVLDDVRSDNAVDNLSDDALRDVPDHWLLPDAVDRPSQN